MFSQKLFIAFAMLFVIMIAAQIDGTSGALEKADSEMTPIKKLGEGAKDFPCNVFTAQVQCFLCNCSWVNSHCTGTHSIC